MSMKTSNRTRDLLACSTVPEPTAPPRTAGNCRYWNNFRMKPTASLFFFGFHTLIPRDVKIISVVTPLNKRFGNTDA